MAVAPVLALLLGPLGPATPVRNDQVAVGRKGAVVAADPVASRVGLAVLERGGNAVDAAVATFLTLAVVHPQAGNLGGGGFLVARMADGRTMALDFRETAPGKAHKDMFLGEDGEVAEGKSLDTALAAGVPGSPYGIWLAWKRLGKVEEFERLVRPAIELARRGFVVDRFLAEAFAEDRERLERWDGTKAAWWRDGRPPSIGDRFVQADLADTLERLAEKGPEGFYTGPTADKVVAEMRRTGGWITAADLAAYRPVEREVLRGKYRGHEVLTMPPPSSGGVALLQMLRLLELRPMGELGCSSVRGAHWLIEAMKRAYADRARWLGDPAFFEVPVAGLVSEGYAKKLAEGMRDDRATAVEGPGDPTGFREESRETTHFSVVDAEGNAVSCTTTLNSGFGNGQVVTGAGFVLNNEMDDFSAKPGVPNQFGLVGAEANAVAAGKRPLSSMTPTIVVGPDGALRLVLGSPGGGRIITTVLQVLSNVVDHGLPVEVAVRAPRLHQQWRPAETSWELLALSKDTRARLEEMGHRFRAEPSVMGRCQAIERLPDGRYVAAADPRSGGAAVAY
ncbi:MAG: gamma-glutamyltransferase [Planctomycetota bacterium]